MDATELSWHAAYPPPKSPKCGGMTPSEVLSLLRSADGGEPKTFALIDLRRNDHEGGTIRGSMNLPAQSLYPSIPTVYSILRAAGISTVIWFCGSSRGRGTRAAGWFKDYIEDQKDDKMCSVVLLGGIKGWVAAGEEYISYIDEYNPGRWGQKQG
ncbi:hypothetical protein CCHL11_06519 [Colletotrichum chlorophyti]|uniref:Rhodanese domain-containing protein n=1 Tax=Colletotrichum chlorophyti TaxID=708187 RepID=A0A1Q8RRV8_9PEZI|nr:hypothetical protein CCHL11_06519 [Colletotrichum chlorophyti]